MECQYNQCLFMLSSSNTHVFRQRNEYLVCRFISTRGSSFMIVMGVVEDSETRRRVCPGMVVECALKFYAVAM